MPGSAMVGRDDLLREVDRAGSVLVVGAPGVGLTTFLAAVADASSAELVRGGTPGGPFGPVLPLLDRAGLSPDDPLQVLRTLPGRLLGSGGRLVVDDAARVDPSTAVLLAQAARLGVVVVLGVARTTDLPGPLRDVGVALPRVTLPPLSYEDAATMAADRAGETLDPPTTSALWRRSRGNPAVIADLVDTAIAQGQLHRTPAGLHLTRLAGSAVALATGGWTEEVLQEHEALVGRLAVAGTLPVAVLDADRLAAAAAAGVVVEDGVTAAPAGALLGDRALAGLPADARRAIAAEVATSLVMLDDPAWESRVRVLRTLAGDDDAVLDTVAWLRGQDRREEALELIDRVGRPGPEHLLARADVLADLGQTTDALEALDAAAADGGAEVVAAVVDRLAQLLGGSAEDDERLERRVVALTPRLPDHVRDDVGSALARRRVIRGARTDDLAADPLAALIRESLTGSLVAAREAADPMASTAPRDSLDHHLRVLVHFLGLVYDGAITEARDIAEREFAAAHAGAHPVLGLWAYNRTKIALHAGQYEISAELGREMRRLLAWRDPFGLLVSGEALHASALARCGDLNEAEAIVAGLTDDDVVLPRARLGVARVRAERALLTGDTETGAAVLTEAGLHAVAHDEAHSGLLGLDEAFWLRPTPEAARHLLEAADRSDLTRAFAARASALLAQDAASLAAVAANLEAMIQPGRAAATWLAVAEVETDAGRPEAAAAAHRQAARLALQWRCRPWPSPPSPAAALSARELEVARHAAARRRSREIADALSLSVRTVENHLARVYRKVSVRNREELAEVLGLPVPTA